MNFPHPTQYRKTAKRQLMRVEGETYTVADAADRLEISEDEARKRFRIAAQRTRGSQQVKWSELGDGRNV